MQLAHPRSRPSRRISLTPLIDIVFILLLFFILETNFLGLSELALNLPPREESGDAQREALQIQVFADGRLWLAGQALDTAGLSALLSGGAYGPDTPVLLAVDEPVRVQQIVNLVDILKGHALSRVQIVPLES